MLDQSSIHIRANAPEENPNHWTPNWLTEINTCWYAARWRTMLKRFLPAVSRAPKMRKEMESQLLFKCSIYINLFIYLFTVFVLFNVFQCFHSYKSSEKSLTSPPLFMRAWKRRSFGTTRGDHMGHMGHMAWKVHDVSGCVWMCPDVPLLPQTTATNVSECWSVDFRWSFNVFDLGTYKTRPVKISSHCLFTLGSTYHHIRARERTKFRSGGLFSLQSRLSRIQLNQYLATQLQKQTQLLDGMGYVYLCVTICCFFSTDWLTDILDLCLYEILLKSFVLPLC